ncbi:MAG: hypothetical protein FWG79_03840 [Bacteroidales bacterium]|nr:hypothetical protein [Bacteroidales bacterium]
MKTRYEKGSFKTEARIGTSASQKNMSNLIAEIHTHARRIEIDSLDWLTKGLAGKEEGRNLIEIEYVNSEFNRNTKIFDLFVNVRVGIFNRRFNNIKISMLMNYENDLNGLPFISIKLNQPNFLLKEIEGTLSIDKTHFVIRTSVQFGWFFNLFISMSNYNAVAEWRIQTVLKNMKETVESRL